MRIAPLVQMELHAEMHTPTACAGQSPPPCHYWSTKLEKLVTADITYFIVRVTAIYTANTCLNQTQNVSITFHAAALISFSRYVLFQFFLFLVHLIPACSQ